MLLFRSLLMAAFIAGVLACGSTPAGLPDNGPRDLGPVESDSGATPVDLGPEDAGVDAGAPPDQGTPPDLGVTDCGYLDLGVFIADCDGRFRYVRQWGPTGGATVEMCPEYWTIDGIRAQFRTAEAALDAGTCTPDCLRGAAMSVSLIRCGVRSGYIVYRDRGEDCGELIETPDGIFTSVEAWDEAAPCP